MTTKSDRDFGEATKTGVGPTNGGKTPFFWGDVDKSAQTCLFFTQIAFAIGVLASSLGVGDRGISGFVARGGCHLGCHWWCLIADVAGRCRGGCCLGCCWECRWWWSDCVLRKVRVLLVIFDCVGECCWWRLIVGCGGCCPGCRWWCLIANVVEGVAYTVSPVSPGGLQGFLGCRWRCLIVYRGVLLVVLDCGCGWEVSWRRVLCGVSLVAWRVSGGV